MNHTFSILLPFSILQASAATLIEDFTYSTGDLLNKGSATGGWSGAWGAAGNTTSRINTNSSQNLSYAAGGYAVSQPGTGYVSGDYGTDFRGMNRSVSSSLSGTVWFSILISSDFAENHGGILLNYDGTGNDYSIGSNYVVDLYGTSLQLIHGGTNIISDSLSASYALGTTHLLLGRIDLTAGADTISLWMDPSDLANISGITPNIVSSALDIGTSLTKVGVFSYNDTTANSEFVRLDALRISDGDGDPDAAFQAVTGIPEPASFALFVGGLSIAGLSRRRKRRETS